MVTIMDDIVNNSWTEGQVMHICISELDHHHFDGSVQERHNSIAKALELRLSCTNPPICSVIVPH